MGISMVHVVMVFASARMMPPGAALCSQPYCPPPWTAFQGHCYFWVDLEMSWMEAERYCQMLSHPGKFVHLVSLNSDEEGGFVSAYVQSLTGAPLHYWIGYNDIEQEGVFKWADGSESLSPQWKPGEPNNSGGEDCVERVLHNGTWLWNDLSCSDKRRFVCGM